MIKGAASDAVVVIDSAPPRHASWITASQLIIADVIGVGVMTLAEAFAELGWALGISICVLMLPLNIFCGYMVWDANVVAYERALSMADLALHAVGKRLFLLTAGLLYSFFLLTLANYLLSIGLCFKQIFLSANLTQPAWALLAAVVVFPLCQIRTLNATWMLLWLNSITIVLALGLAFGSFISEGQAASLARTGGKTEIVASDLSWESFMSGSSKFAFAYVGVMMYPEIMAEMTDPREFPKALVAGAPFQLLSYLLVSCVGYASLGSNAQGLLIADMRQGPLSQAAASALLVHIVITYLIKGTVLVRAFHRFLSPATVNDTSLRGTTIWGLLTAATLTAAYLLAVAVPFFDEITSLGGSLQTPLLGFCLPVVLFLSGHRATGRHVNPLQFGLLLAVFFFGLVFCALATTATTTNIVDKWRHGGAEKWARGGVDPSTSLTSLTSLWEMESLGSVAQHRGGGRHDLTPVVI